MWQYVCQTKSSVTTGEPSNYQLANFRFGYGSKSWAIAACHFTIVHVRTKRPKVKGKIQADLEPYPVTFQCPGCSNYFQIFNSPRRDPKWRMRANAHAFEGTGYLEISPFLECHLFMPKSARKSLELIYLFYCFFPVYVSVRSSKSAYFLGQKTSAWSSVRAGRSCWAPSAASRDWVSPHDGSSDLWNDHILEDYHPLIHQL
jgi:hypothetical protein